MLLAPIRHAVTRRRVLRARFELARQREQLEESCIPSYLHPNPAAAAVAWWRLFAAARLHRTEAPAGPVLDFGAACGELRPLLPASLAYEFVEADDGLAAALLALHPGATRRVLENLPRAHYAAVFALDSLEHNRDVAPLLDRLVAALAPGGVLILCGPTENRLYRLGRRLAGFSGHYHVTTIRDIEAIAARRLRLRRARLAPPGVPLFSLTVWTHPEPV